MCQASNHIALGPQLSVVSIEVTPINQQVYFQTYASLRSTYGLGTVSIVETCPLYDYDNVHNTMILWIKVL